MPDRVVAHAELHAAAGPRGCPLPPFHLLRRGGIESDHRNRRRCACSHPLVHVRLPFALLLSLSLQAFSQETETEPSSNTGQESWRLGVISGKCVYRSSVWRSGSRPRAVVAGGGKAAVGVAAGERALWAAGSIARKGRCHDGGERRHAATAEPVATWQRGRGAGGKNDNAASLRLAALVVQVEAKRLELSTSSMPWMRSTKTELRPHSTCACRCLSTLARGGV